MGAGPFRESLFRVACLFIPRSRSLFLLWTAFAVGRNAWLCRTLRAEETHGHTGAVGADFEECLVSLGSGEGNLSLPIFWDFQGTFSCLPVSPEPGDARGPGDGQGRAHLSNT